MKKAILLLLSVTVIKFSLAQYPSTLKTSYRQIRIATPSQEGEPMTDASCIIWYLDKINNGLVSRTVCDNIDAITYKITRSDPIMGTSSSWSKRYFGYNPKDPFYLNDGTLMEDIAITVINNNGKYSVMEVLTVVDKSSGQTMASSLSWFYNL